MFYLIKAEKVFSLLWNSFLRSYSLLLLSCRDYSLKVTLILCMAIAMTISQSSRVKYVLGVGGGVGDTVILLHI